MSVSTVNLERIRKIKVKKILNYFLRNKKYSFFDVSSKYDEIDNGYYVNFVSEDLDYNTFLSDEYLDNSTLDFIRQMLEISIDGYLEE